VRTTVQINIPLLAFDTAVGLFQQFTSCQTIYNGSLDTVILSKFPIVNQRFDKYRLSPVWIQGSLHAQIQLPNGSNPVDVFCTHPVTDAPLVNFEKTNLDQARNLVEIVQSQVSSSQNLALVMGDFNSGPEINQRDTANPALDKDVKSLFPRSYDEFINAGWQDTLTAVGTRNCTWCPDQNPLTSGGPFWLDHIFIAKNSSSSCLINSSIFANQSIVQVPSQANPVPLSDHFGVQATFCT
jgi:endonuclease/exonuclease/phosphatase family metal-dependent hydrolase